MGSGSNRAGTKRAHAEFSMLFGSDGTGIVIPPPSSNTADCWRFYNHQAVSQYLTDAFRLHAVKACTVTGNATEMNAIRMELQVLYSSMTPANGKQFTASEHKQIHDQAYKKAGCTTESAALWGWVIVDTVGFQSGGRTVSLREWVVKYSIKTFGRCELPPSK